MKIGNATFNEREKGRRDYDAGENKRSPVQFRVVGIY